MKKIKIRNPAKRVKVILEEDETLVSYGGGLLVDEFIYRLGLPHIIDNTVKGKERERGYKESEAVLGLVISIITGGVCLDDLVVLREEESFKSIWRHGEIPHPTTMGDFLRRFDLVVVLAQREMDFSRFEINYLERGQRLQQLEEKLRRKHEVLSELMEEHVKLKKELGEI